MNDGTPYNTQVNWKKKRNCIVCGSRRKSAHNPEKICASCWRDLS